MKRKEELEEFKKRLGIEISDKELKEIKAFLERLAQILVESYLEGDLIN